MDREAFDIAFFMHDLAGGGVERMRLRLAVAMTSRGHRVTLVLQHVRGDLAGQIPNGINVVNLDRSGVLPSLWALDRWLRQAKPDIVISSLDHNNIAALCAGMMATGRTRIVICQHNALSAEAAMGWKYRLVPMCYRLLAPRAAAIVAVSRGVADDLSRVTGIDARRISVISNPVTDGGEPDREAVPVQHRWLAEAVPVFLFVGRLSRQKDPATLLRAFALRLRAGEARLIFLGGGELHADLVAQSKALGVFHATAFAGFVADPLPWMARAQALVLCSRYEGFGNVIVEALACGTPVIATDCPYGPAEILQHGQFGRLVPVGDAPALAAAMETDLRAEFPAARLRARAAAFSVDACARRHERLCHAIVQHHRGTAFGLRFTALAVGAIADMMVTNSSDCQTRLIVTPNIDHVRLLRRPVFADAYRSAALVCADGLPVALYAWLRAAAPARRRTGCDILHALLHHPRLSTRRVVAVVESTSTQAAAHAWLDARALASRWHIIVAPHDLGACPELASAMARQIAAAMPDIVVMTLGAPVSEEFIQQWRKTLPPCWVLCCGQALRIELGLARRAPALFRRAGLEWAWRVAQEPRRLLPRYASAAAWFPCAIVADLWPAPLPSARVQ
jgi:exopolysaccharide biosynthesis WecB/TagA/CpsF family protein